MTTVPTVAYEAGQEMRILPLGGTMTPVGRSNVTVAAVDRPVVESDRVTAAPANVATLMGGVNDSVEDARRLPVLLRGIPAKLNVIPMNPHGDSPYRPPEDAVVDRFTAAVHEGGLRVTLRRDRGRDIDAACGQLAARGLEAGRG